jgi:hypothetical protein
MASIGGASFDLEVDLNEWMINGGGRENKQQRTAKPKTS